MVNPEKLAAMIRRHEGLRLKPYLCPAGKQTIGYGRNIEDRGITADEAEYLLRNDIRTADNDLNAVFGANTVLNWSDPRYAALLDMMFQLGLTRFLGFRSMIAAVKAGDWQRAAAEMLDSDWARQTPARVAELAEMIRTDSWQGE